MKSYTYTKKGPGRQRDNRASKRSQALYRLSRETYQRGKAGAKLHKQALEGRIGTPNI